MSMNVLVFGAYGGIGSDLSRRLHAEGAKLALSGRDESKLRDLADELGVAAFPADASEFDSVDAVATQAAEVLGTIDGVVNCSGSLLLKPAHMTSFDEFKRTIDANLTSSFAILRAVARPMMKAGRGSVVMVSTAAAAHGLPNHEAIAAAKGGVDALVRSAAATYGGAGVRVNSVAPGLVETPLTSRITKSSSARSASESMHVLGRLGSPRDISGAIAWLLSAEASWVTGQTLGVDGGLGAVRSS